MTIKSLLSIFKTKILKIFFVAEVFLFAGIGLASAAPDMSKNTVARSLYLQYWDIKWNTTWMDNFIKELDSTHVDNVQVYAGNCYFLREMYPSAGYYHPAVDSGGVDMLDIFINKLHAANKTIALMSHANYVEGTGSSDCKSYFGTSWFPKKRDGSNLMTTHLDFTYPEARNKVIDMALYAVTHHDFDGMWWEEPGMYNAGITSEYQIEWSWEAGYKADGYGDPRLIPVGQMTQTQLLHMVQQKEKGMTLFFKEWHEALDSLGPDYKYPYFWTEAMLNINAFNRNCINGGNCAAYGTNITDLSKKGYIDRYTTESWAGYRPLSNFKETIADLIVSTPEIYHTALGYITESGCQSDAPYICLKGTYMSPYFFTVIDNMIPYGATSESIYAYGFWKYTTYPSFDTHPELAGIQSWCAYMGYGNNCNVNTAGAPYNVGMTPYEYLKAHPPKISRTFNPIGKHANSAVLTPTFSHLRMEAGAYPNPYIKGKSVGCKINFDRLGKDAVIKIYTTNGELVEKLIGDSKGKAEWEIKNIANRIYLYVVTSPDGTKNGKVSIIK